VVENGWVLSAYPPFGNSGAELNDILTFVNSYGNSDYVSVTFAAAETNPIVIVLPLGGDSNVDNGLRTVVGSGTCLAGSTLVSIAFTCDHKDIIGTTVFRVFATAEIRDSVSGGNLIGIGSTEINANEGVINYLTITNLSAAAQSGYWVYVYLMAYRVGVTPPTNITATPGVLEQTLALNEPTIFITEIWVVPTGTGWTYDQSGLADAKTITVSYRMALNTRVQSCPSWLTIIDSEGVDITSGNYIYREGFENEDIRLYPITDNLSSSDLTGPVVLTNESGETYDIHVTHYKEAIAKTITLSISDSDITGLWFHLGVRRSAEVYTTASIRLICTFDSDTVSSGAYFNVYWRCYVNGISRGNSNFKARNAKGVYTGLPTYEIDKILSIEGVALDKYTDTIVIYFAGNSI
jgi:hypothetical protein